MNTLKNLRIGIRIGLAFAACIGLLIMVAAVGIGSLRSVNASLHAITDDFYVKVKLIGEVTEEINKQARFARNVVILDPQQRGAEIEAIKVSRNNATKLYDKLVPLVTSDQGKQALDVVQRERTQYRASMDKFIELASADKIGEARAQLIDSMRKEQLEYMAAMDKFSELQESLMDHASKDAESNVARSTWVLVAAAVLATLMATVAGWFIARSITVPVGDAVRLAEAVASGDLTTKITIQGRDEIGQLLQALQRMNDGLVDIVAQVRSSSDSIATGSGQIATGNADLSQRTEEQASNLQQTAASMEQLSSTVKNNADTARQAAQMADAASTVATKGGDVVGRVVATMDAISSASKRIADIIGTIDGIAFQTNILALNAAVEAARAGEQGRGFAVVAGEVRALAQRSSEAAREIRSLIGANVEQVEGGATLVAEAGSTMQDIVQQVQRVNDLLGEIGTATGEQTEGIGQISNAVTQLDQVTQQNAALVEESAAAADSLSQQARALVGVVARFKLAPA